nr:hypothetical protein [Candidatus Sigynarchaeota archaeon]
MLKNDHTSNEFQNPFLKMNHTLAASPGDKMKGVYLIPAWINSPENKIRVKMTFLEIIRSVEEER